MTEVGLLTTAPVAPTHQKEIEDKLPFGFRFWAEVAAWIDNECVGDFATLCNDMGPTQVELARSFAFLHYGMTSEWSSSVASCTAQASDLESNWLDLLKLSVFLPEDSAPDLDAFRAAAKTFQQFEEVTNIDRITSIVEQEQTDRASGFELDALKLLQGVSNFRANRWQQGNTQFSSVIMRGNSEFLKGIASVGVAAGLIVLPNLGSVTSIKRHLGRARQFLAPEFDKQERESYCARMIHIVTPAQKDRIAQLEAEKEAAEQKAKELSIAIEREKLRPELTRLAKVTFGDAWPEEQEANADTLTGAFAAKAGQELKVEGMQAIADLAKCFRSVSENAIMFGDIKCAIDYREERKKIRYRSTGKRGTKVDVPTDTWPNIRFHEL